MHDSARYPRLRPEVPWVREESAVYTPAHRRIVGLDLGKSQDFTAVTVLDWTEASPAVPRPDYRVTNLKRFPLGTEYTEITAWLVRFFQTADPARHGEPPPALVVDETGCGAPVVEMIRVAFDKAAIPGFLVAVTITAGSGVTNTIGRRGHWRVAKSVLASVLVTLFQSRRLHIAQLPGTATLLKEAQAFSVKVTPAGNETFLAWRESDKDDTVLSLALACWAAETIVWPPWPEENRGA
jgi:hypothetical protein